MSRFVANWGRRWLSGEGLRLLDTLPGLEKHYVQMDSSVATFPLERMKKLLNRLGDPQDGFRVIQVAGSSGKGSVATLLASIYSATDTTVGLCTSPHVLSITERIRVSQNGSLAPIPLNDLDALIYEHRTLFEALADEGHGPTYFEVLIALTCLHFARKGVQYAVIESGLGGPTDGTNVFKDENVDGTVICALEEEHVGALGANLEEIVQNEVAIAKPHCPVILAPQFSPVVRDQVLAICSAQQSPVVDEAEQISVGGLNYGFAENSLRQRIDINIPASLLKGSQNLKLEGLQMQLLGQHQLQNVKTALVAALVAQEQGWPLTEAALRRGIQETFLPGRVQVQRASLDSEWYVLDGAHTKHAARALAKTLRGAFPEEPLVLILGMSTKKQHDAILSEMLSMEPDVVIFTASSTSLRAMPPGTLLAKWEQHEAEFRKQKRFRCRKTLSTNVATALIKAQTELRGISKPRASSLGVICISGSFYILGEAMESLPPEWKPGGSSPEANAH